VTDLLIFHRPLERNDRGRQGKESTTFRERSDKHRDQDQSVEVQIHIPDDFWLRQLKFKWSDALDTGGGVHCQSAVQLYLLL